MEITIAICSIKERQVLLTSLLTNLQDQIYRLSADKKVEVLVHVDNKEKTTGKKRNECLKLAKGKYIIFLDDDDGIPYYYVPELLRACKSGADCFSIKGMKVQGEKEELFFISKDIDYAKLTDEKGRKVYHRYTNHITGIKTNIAKKIEFPDQTVGEDYAWSMKLKDSGLLKTEYEIKKSPMYIYKFNPFKTA